MNNTFYGAPIGYDSMSTIDFNDNPYYNQQPNIEYNNNGGLYIDPVMRFSEDANIPIQKKKELTSSDSQMVEPYRGGGGGGGHGGGGGGGHGGYGGGGGHGGYGGHGGGGGHGGYGGHGGRGGYGGGMARGYGGGMGHGPGYGSGNIASPPMRGGHPGYNRWNSHGGYYRHHSGWNNPYYWGGAGALGGAIATYPYWDDSYYQPEIINQPVQVVYQNSPDVQEEEPKIETIDETSMSDKPVKKSDKPSKPNKPTKLKKKAKCNKMNKEIDKNVLWGIIVSLLVVILILILYNYNPLMFKGIISFKK
jgi:hypothetical protein